MAVTSAIQAQNAMREHQHREHGIIIKPKFKIIHGENRISSYRVRPQTDLGYEFSHWERLGREPAVHVYSIVCEICFKEIAG